MLALRLNLLVGEHVLVDALLLKVVRGLENVEPDRLAVVRLPFVAGLVDGTPSRFRFEHDSKWILGILWIAHGNHLESRVGDQVVRCRDDGWREFAQFVRNQDDRTVLETNQFRHGRCFLLLLRCH